MLRHDDRFAWTLIAGVVPAGPMRTMSAGSPTDSG